MEGSEEFDLEVDSVVDLRLRVAVSDESSVKAEGAVSGQHAVGSIARSGAGFFLENPD